MSIPAPTLRSSMLTQAAPAPHRPHRPMKRPGDEGAALAAAAQAVAVLAGGPLGLHAQPARREIRGIDDLASGLRVGRTANGCDEVQLDLRGGAFAGCEARLVAGKHGLEILVLAPSEQTRRLVEGDLADLARSLERRGLRVTRVRAMTRAEQAREREASGSR
jgi:hypothetical protein